MRVLFDQGTPAPLRRVLIGHEVATAYECGWATLKNGELLAIAEEHRFDVLLTTDTHLKYQQNLSSRRIAVVVIGTTSWPRIRAVGNKVLEAVDLAEPGSYFEIAVP